MREENENGRRNMRGENIARDTEKKNPVSRAICVSIGKCRYFPAAAFAKSVVTSSP